MGHTGGQTPQGGQTPAPGDLLFQPPHFRHVPKEDHMTGKGAILLAERCRDHIERKDPVFRHDTIDFPFDHPVFLGECPEKVPAALRKGRIRRLPENLKG